MKRFLLFIFCLIATNSTYCSYVGNPSFPALTMDGFFTTNASWGSCRIGYEGDFTSDARLEQVSTANRKVDNFKQDVNSASFTINFLNRCDLFAIAGAAKIKTNWRIETIQTIFNQIELETTYDLSWAAGGKILLFEWANTSLGIGGRYYYTRPGISWVTIDGTPTSITDSKCRFRQWQIDCCLSHKIDIFIPYIGCKYLQSRARISGVNAPIADDSSYGISMKNKCNYGLVLGCSLTKGKIFTLNIEARLIDEEAVAISGDVRF